jgi:hypothetical protein
VRLIISTHTGQLGQWTIALLAQSYLFTRCKTSSRVFCKFMCPIVHIPFAPVQDGRGGDKYIDQWLALRNGLSVTKT